MDTIYAKTNKQVTDFERQKIQVKMRRTIERRMRILWIRDGGVQPWWSHVDLESTASLWHAL